ncbi:MAG: putative aminohydrolase SsnA [Ignavibacteria bacterium]|jgi:putative selenium metabolism protein SsnA|nr:putative aminohydrolase SsnA [Ignavibacteria bacterium]MCU7502318.1 putative aminohydrolase SsnA [Ignavibacteria bacterium]MCU7516638.1 putative aminohydrolase SsnA [Ignavibacteria bacterium]
MIVLKNANVISFYPPLLEKNKTIVIEGNKIVDKSDIPLSKQERGRVIDCSGKYVSPGLVCSHNHFYSVLARGILANISPSKDFTGVLKNLWWRLDKALDEESLFYSAITGALEAIQCGTTSVIDHSASPCCIRGSLSILRSAFLEAGLRGILCYEVTERNGRNGALEGLEESLEFIKSLDCRSLQEKETALLEGAIGAHALFTLGNDTLKLIGEALDKTKRGLHIHVAEDRFDASYSRHFFNMDIVERLEAFGLLNEKSILAHGVHLGENEIETINKHDSFLVHNPRSNMNNSVGYMDKLKLVANPALGTDGLGSDMIEEFKAAFYKSSDAKAGLSPEFFLKALQNGNRILKRYFGRNFGRIEKGYEADLVIFNYHSPTPVASENLAGHMAFGFSRGNVETVIINGSITLENGSFPFDTEPLYRKARLEAQRLWKKITDSGN